MKQYYSKEEKGCDVRKIAYILATAKHETARTFNPIKEYGGKSYFQGMYNPVLGKNKKRRKNGIRKRKHATKRWSKILRKRICTTYIEKKL